MPLMFRPSKGAVDQALSVMLAALTMLGLGIFGPGIATGLVSGAPQLGAGAAAGTALAATGLAVAGGAAVAGVGRFAARGGATMRAATTLVSSARAGYSEAKFTGTPTGIASGSAGAARGSPGSNTASSAHVASASPESSAPAWAQQMRRRQSLVHGASTATQVLRASDHGGSGANPRLGEGEGD